MESNDISRAPINILWVDDEKPVLSVAEKMSKKLGYGITCLADSVEALELIAAQPEMFDLLITDVAMPRLTGGTLAEAVLKIRPSMPIIFCTGYKESIPEDKVKAMGGICFLFKPFSLRELDEMVQKMLTGF